MELSLRRLQMLMELRRRGTVTAVGAAMHYSPSAISQQLAQLERETGAKLVRRHGRGLLLTDLGTLLAAHAEEILASVDRAMLALEDARDGLTASLTVGVWASVASGLIPPALRALAQSHPGIGVATFELAPEQTAERVRDGSLDLSFVIDYPSYPMQRDRSIQHELVAHEQLHAAVPAHWEHPAAYTLAAMAELPWILAGPASHFGTAVRLLCREAGFEPTIKHSVEEQSTALSMVAGGLGVTMVSDLGLSWLPAGVDVVPIEPFIHRMVYLAHRFTAVPRRSVGAVIDAVRAASAAQGLLPQGPTVTTGPPPTTGSPPTTGPPPTPKPTSRTPPSGSSAAS